MKIKKLYLARHIPNHYVVKLENGNFARFYAIPFRKIVNSDLIPVPFYQDNGNHSKEAESYIYNLYGLEKMEG